MGMGLAKFPLPGGPNRIPTFAYADELMVVVPNETTVAKTLDHLDSHHEANGARINKDMASLYVPS